MTPERVAQVRALNDVAAARGQTLVQLALAWVLRWPQVTSALNAPPLTDAELEAIEAIPRVTPA